MQHSVKPEPQKSTKKTNSMSRDKYFKTAQPYKKLFKNSGTDFPTGKEETRVKIKESKITSTEATRSFQA